MAQATDSTSGGSVYGRRSLQVLAELRDLRREPLVVPELDELERLRGEGQPLRALHKTQKIIDTLAGAGQIDDIHRLLWIRGHKQVLECLADLRQVADVQPTLRRFLRGVRSPEWKAWRKDVGVQYKRLIALDADLGQFEEALDVYAEGRDMLELDAGILRQLATAAAGLHREDDGTVELYLTCLESAKGADDLRRGSIPDALRAAIVIDFDRPSPKRLRKMMKFNRRAVLAGQLFWARVHEAVGFVRLGEKAEADGAVKACLPLDEADAESLTLLGVIACHRGEWQRAVDLLDKAAAAGRLTADGRYYAALAAANQALLAPESFVSPEACREALAKRREALASHMLQGVKALNGPWVLLQLAVACDDTQAMAGFVPPADGPLPRYRHVAAWVHALWICGDRAPLDAWAARIDIADRPALFLAKSAEGLWHLLDGDADAARTPIQVAVELAGDKRVAQVDPDVRPAASALNRELQMLCGGRATAEPATEGNAADAGTPTVAAQVARLTAWEAIRDGRFDDAAARIAERCHDAGPPWLADRMRVVVDAHRGEQAAAEERVGALLQRAPDRPVHRLLAGAWHLARKRYDEAVSAVSPVMTHPVARRDGPVILGEALLALGRHEEARSLLATVEGDARGAVPPLPRLWRLKIPPEDWRLDPALGDVADLCHLAELMLDADLPDQTIRLLQNADRHLKVESAAAREWVGGLLDRAALCLVKTGQFTEACRMRGLARARRGHDAAFAESLARAIAEEQAHKVDVPLTLPDEVLEEFAVYAAAWQGDDAVFGDTAPGAVLMKGLRIDEQQPGPEAEQARRMAWTQRFAGLRKGWTWPHTNAARAELRANEPVRCLECLAHIPDTAKSGEDFWIQGSAWVRQDALDRAREAFGLAATGGFRAREARVMHGFCLVVNLWRTQPEAALDVEALLADFAGHGQAEEGLAEEFAELALLCRAAVLLVVGRAEEAAQRVAPFEPKVQPPAMVAVIGGLAAVRLGRPNDAAAAWRQLGEVLPPNDDLRLLALWLHLEQPGFAVLPEVAEELEVVRRSGHGNRLFHWLVAAYEFRRGRTQEAVAAVEAAKRAAHAWLRPLMSFMNAEVDRLGRIVEAWRTLAEGRFAEAAGALAAVEKPWIGGGWASLLQGVAHAQGGNVREARRLLEPEAADNVDAAAVLAQVAVREGDLAAARKWLTAVHRREQDHPLAQLVGAEVAEADGQVDQACHLWQQVAEAADHVPPRLRAAARMALGRRAEAAGDMAEADRQYEMAIALDSTWSAAAERIAYLAAKVSDVDQAKAQKAIALLEAVPVRDRALGAWLAAAVLADRANRPADLAEALAQAVRHPAYSDLGDAERSTVARWSVAVQLRQEEFSEASVAIKAILVSQDSPELRALLVNCRMLEAGKLLREGVTEGQVLDQVAAAADDVLTQEPRHPIALLLAATARALKGEAPGPAHAALVERFKDIDWDSPDLKLLAEINKVLGGSGAIAQMDVLLDAVGVDADERRYLQMLAANQGRNASRLAELAGPLVAESPLRAECLPVAPRELAVFMARHHLEEGRPELAEGVLARLHKAGLDDAQTRWLQALAMARSATRLLEEKEYEAACTHLRRAEGLLKGTPAEGE